MSPKAVVDTGKTVTASSLQAVVSLVHMAPAESLKIQRKIGSLFYVAFDILFYDGKDVQTESYETREALLSSAVEILKMQTPNCLSR